MTAEPQGRDGSARAYQALGHRFRIDVDERLPAHFEAAVRWAFEGLEVPGPDRSPGREHRYRLAPAADDGSVVRIQMDDDPELREVLRERAPATLMTEINRRAVASQPANLAVHAGALSFHGAGLLVAGPSGSGKSTLTGALVACGCDYLTDEAASISPESLEVQPYAKPLSLSPSSMAALGCRDNGYGLAELVPASSIRTGSYGEASPVRVILFPRFDTGARTGLTAVSRAEALVALAENSFNFVDHGGAWLPYLRDVAAPCACWRVEFGKALDAAAQVLSLLKPGT